MRAGIRVQAQESEGVPDAESDSGQEHKGKVGGRASKRHQARAVGVTACPVRIIGSTGKSDHAVEEKETEQGKNHHAVRGAANVGDGVERDLAAECGRRIAAELRNKRVGSFVACRGGKKSHVENEPERQGVGREIGHRSESLEFHVPESKRRSLTRGESMNPWRSGFAKAINSRKPRCRSKQPDDIHENPDRQRQCFPFAVPNFSVLWTATTCVGRLLGVRRKWELRSRDEGLFPTHTRES